MQLAKQNYFYERALFYSSFGIQEQMLAGEGRYDFPPVYFIALLDFSLHEGSDRVLFRFDLRERETQELMTDPDRDAQTGRMLSEQEDYRNSS